MVRRLFMEFKLAVIASEFSKAETTERKFKFAQAWQKQELRADELGINSEMRNRIFAKAAAM